MEKEDSAACLGQVHFPNILDQNSASKSNLMAHTAQYGIGIDLRENPTHAFSEYVQHHKQMKTL
jgi:hypothetical protein|tara:strand:+ start:141 stop:332 length:192 start_codon:yes stop_codon:yes gene_type:complete